MKNPEYILHATPEKRLNKIVKEGFLYKNGYPTVTGSLAFVLNHATKQGYKEKPETLNSLRKILVMESPTDKIIAPGFKGTIQVDDKNKEIHGNPKIWAAGPMESGIYDSQEIFNLSTKHKLHTLSKTELKEFIKNKQLDQSQTLHQNIVAILSPSQNLTTLLLQLRRGIFSLKTIDFDQYAKKIKKEIEQNNENRVFDGVSVDELVEKILKTTIHQEVLNFSRTLYLMAKEAAGYKIFKHDKQISILEQYEGVFDNLSLLKEKINHKTEGNYDFDLTGQKDLQWINSYLRRVINKVSKIHN